MTKSGVILQRYVAPFLMGACMAGAASSGPGPMLALIAAALAFGVVSFPAWGRFLARVTAAA